MPVFESSRKVQLFGSSLALTLPALFVKANEVEKGSVVKVLYDLDGILLVSTKENIEAAKESITDIIKKLDKLVRDGNTKK